MLNILFLIFLLWCLTFLWKPWQDSLMNRKLKTKIEKVEIFCNIISNLVCNFWLNNASLLNKHFSQKSYWPQTLNGRAPTLIHFHFLNIKSKSFFSTSYFSFQHCNSEFKRGKYLCKSFLSGSKCEYLCVHAFLRMIQGTSHFLWQPASKSCLHEILPDILGWKSRPKQTHDKHLKTRVKKTCNLHRSGTA